MKKYLYIYILLISFAAFSQKKDSLPKPLDEYVLLKKGDTLLIKLDEISILPKNKYKSQLDIRYYYWFRRKVFKAYPYAKLAAERIDTLNVRLSKIKSKRKRKRYIKRIQKYLEGEFTAPLKKMTSTEGRILIKLIHRQTGKTTYQNIKNLRSGWKAFWYNATANIFKLSLKSEYHPESNNEDYLIETILFKAFTEERLQEQPTKLKFNFIEIAANKKGEINVEKYKEMFAKTRKKRERKKKRLVKKAIKAKKQ